MPVITSVEDLRRLAERRVPRMFYDYCAAGSWTETTLRANTDDLNRIKLRQRVGVNIEHRSTRSTMCGTSVAMPVALAPTGLAGMMHADGEILAARAAERFGVPFTLSTMSICSIEDVAAGPRSRSGSSSTSRATATSPPRSSTARRPRAAARSWSRWTSKCSASATWTSRTDSPRLPSPRSAA